MDQDRWNQIQSVFEQALAIPAAERSTFVRAACGDDSELADEIEALLAADSDDSLVIGTGGDADEIFNLDKHLEGSELGAYKLIRRIGVGGMGSVFLAERADGSFERNVALKVVKKGMDTESVLRRFQIERDILARLDHPNIATLLDGGVTDDGRPYFVMEHVDGMPITRYCDENRLGIPQRLRLFQLVCGAVHYAHQSLVVHRDLKPSNILVTEDGTVKLLDFGIAKLLDDPAGDDLTRTGMAILTPAYASPEQLMNKPVTTGTDVYALGVILYELLSGRRPFEVWKTDRELREQVLRDSPPKPSTAVTHVPASDDKTSSLTAKQVSDVRSTATGRLQQSLRGDLDTICLMAIRKEAENRYPSAREMATDIDRHLNGLPVVARPDSKAYRFGKFVQRHRAGVAITAITVIAFISMVAFYTSRIAAERDAAIEERQKVDQVVAFVTGLFEISDPYESRGTEITARDLLEAGSQQIDNDLADQPELKSTMMRVLGEVYYSLSSYEEAEKNIRGALELQLATVGELSVETAKSRLILGQIYQDGGDYPEAEEQFQLVLDTRRQLLGNDNAAVLEALSAQAFLEETRGEYDVAEELHREVLEMARRLHPDDHIEVAESMSFMAGLYRMQDRAADAEPLLRDAIAMLDRIYAGEHPLSAKIKRQLAGLLRNTGRFEEAEPIYVEVIADQERMLGPNHHELAVTWNSYSQLLTDIGRMEEALEANQMLIQIVEHISDGPHPSLGAAYNNLGFLMRDSERYDEALENFQLSLDMQDAVGFSADHVNRTFPTAGIASVYYRTGRFEEAEEIFRRMLVMRTEGFGDEHRLTSEIKSDLAATLMALDKDEEAETLLLDAYQRFMDDRGVDDARTQRGARRLMELYEKLGQPDKAAEYAAIYNSDY